MSPVAAAGLSPVRHALGNGVVLLTEHTATHPAVTIYATLDAGNLHDPDSSPGLANFVARVIDRGTESRSPDEIAEALDGRGVSLTAGVTRHLLSLSCTCLSEDIEAIMTLVADVIRRPSFPPEQVEKRRTAIVTALRQDQDNPAVVATEGLMALLYTGGHPYGRAGRGTVASVEAIGRNDLVAFHRRRATPDGLRLVVVGDVEPSRVEDLVDRVFGDWRAETAGAVVPPRVSPAQERRETRHVIRRQAAGRHRIRLHDDYPRGPEVLRADADEQRARPVRAWRQAGRQHS